MIRKITICLVVFILLASQVQASLISTHSRQSIQDRVILVNSNSKNVIQEVEKEIIIRRILQSLIKSIDNAKKKGVK